MTDPLNQGKRVAVIGLGNMGSALAERLLATGHAVSVWNRTESRSGPLSKLGAEVAVHPADAIEHSDTIVICVLDIDAVESILAADGVPNALAGKTVIQLTALEPEQSEIQADWMQQHRARYLDGGILGFPADVRAGSVKIAYSGSKSAYQEAASIRDSYGDTSVFIDEQAGKAPQAVMLVFAQYYAITYACMHTAAMAAAAGVTARSLLELSGGEKAWQLIGQTMDAYVEMTQDRDYATEEAALKMDASGYDYFANLSRKLGVEPGLHELIESALNRAIEQGRGEQAIPAIFEILQAGDK